jgi:hypothetical protein
LRSLVLIPILASGLFGCATIERPRVLWGASLGGTSGALGGALLSPNDESRGINALVFGVAGAVAGGLIGYLTEPKAPVPSQGPDLKLLEGLPGQPQSNAHGLAGPVQEAPIVAQEERVIPHPDGIPRFLKERLQPIVIEEYVEPDTVGSDGALHEPHRVYRIKRPAELFAKPISPQTSVGASP